MFEESDTGLGVNSGLLSQINVTPLVDVALVLLIVFMLTAPILQQGVELELPKEKVSKIEGKGDQLVVSVDKEGKIYIGMKNEVELKDLGNKLKAIVRMREDKRVFIRGDRRVSYGRIMEIMANIKNIGIEKVGLVTEPR